MYIQALYSKYSLPLLILCFLFIQKVQAKYSEQQIDSIKQSLSTVRDTQLANSYIRLASSLFVSDEEALEYSHKLANLSDSIGYNFGEIKAYFLMGHIEHYFKNFQTAITSYKSALKVSLLDEDQENIMKGYDYICNSFFFLEEWDSAQHYNQFYMEQCLKAADSLSLAYSFSKEGSYLFNQNLIDLAIQNHIDASKIYEKLNDTTGMIQEYSTLAMILERKGENEDALSYYRKSIAMGFASKRPISTVAPLNNMAVLFREEKQLDSAETKLLLAKKLMESDDALDFFGRDILRENQHAITINFCNLRVEQERFQEAIKMGKELLEKEGEILQKGSRASILFALSKSNLGLNNYKLAEKQGLEALAIKKDIQLMDDYMDILFHLSRLEYARSNFKKAFEYQDMLTSLKDSLNEDENKKTYKALMLEYETEKKENEINSLKQEQLISDSRRNLLLAGLIGISLLAAIVVLFLRFRVVKNRELWEKGIELARMKSRFFTQISHELRTPLTLILGPLSQLKEKYGQSADGVKISLMERNAQRLLQLVNQVMDLSKVQAGRLELHAAPTLVHAQLRYIFSSFDSKAETKNLDYQLILPEEDVELYIDVDKFHQILSNLLSNGCKFTPENGQLHLEAQNLENAFRIELRDNGRGIPPEQLAHIFDPYFQGENARRADEAGTGIGLALTRELVELHGGRIEVRSEVGRGTSFVLTFRKGREHLSSEQINFFRIPESELPKLEKPIEEILEEAPEGKSTGELPLILIAEDIPDMQEFLRSVLEPNFELVFAPNGEEALEIARKETPDVIISDIMMPVMDGISFIKELKTNKLTDHIPVIFLTAKSSMEDRIAGWEQQAQAFLTKPFNPRELLLVVQSALESQKNLQYRFRGEVILKPSEVAISSQEARFLNKLTDYLETHIDNTELSIEELASEMALSRSQLNRKMKALTNKTPTLFVRDFRMQRARQLLEQGFGNVSEVADAVGISSLAYFSRIFTETFGKSPSQWVG